MATATDTKRPGVAQVDRLVDEQGNRIHVPEDSTLRVSDDVERTVGSTGPTSWWQAGLIALGIVALILLLMQVFGGTPGTDVQPGTPVAAPQELAPPAL